MCPQKIPLQTDGTYNLVLQGWVLIIIATHVMTRKSDSKPDFNGQEKISHSSRPFIFVLCKTETELAYSSGFQGLKKVCNIFLSLPRPLRVSSITCDHAMAILNGARAIFSTAVILCC